MFAAFVPGVNNTQNPSLESCQNQFNLSRVYEDTCWTMGDIVSMPGKLL